MTTLAAIKPVLARMTMEDSLLLRLAADADDVWAVRNLFVKYGVPRPWTTAVDFCEARKTGPWKGGAMVSMSLDGKEPRTMRVVRAQRTGPNTTTLRLEALPARKERA